jgi:hypothetical protein
VKFIVARRRFNPDGFDDGVAIYWKTSTLKAGDSTR